MTISMIESILYILTGILAGGSLAAYWTYVSGKKVIDQNNQTSASRIKAAEHQTFLLKEHLEAAQSDIALLKEKVNQERQSKAVELGELRQSLQRGALFFAAYALSIGIMVGGGVSWICTGAQAEVKHLQRVMDIQIESRLAQAQKQMLEVELERLQNEKRELMINLQFEFEQKAVALAKLEALYHSLSGDKGFRGFVADQKKLIQELSRYSADDRFDSSSKVQPSLPVVR